VLNVRPRDPAFGVDEDANHPFKGTIDVHLLRTHQGGVRQAECSSPCRWKGTPQIRGACQYDTYYIVTFHTITRQHFTQELSNGFGHLARIIAR
jgi:hypothetical protein